MLPWCYLSCTLPTRQPRNWPVSCLALGCLEESCLVQLHRASDLISLSTVALPLFTEVPSTSNLPTYYFAESRLESLVHKGNIIFNELQRN